MVGGEGRHCGEDPQCFNRLHPAIPMAARARPGQTIVFRVRNASDFDLDPASTYDDPRAGDGQIGTVHPLAGPVHIEGAEPGDVLTVTLLDVAPGRFGYTSVSPIGFVSDHVRGAFRANWRLDRTEAGQRRPARRAHSERQLPRHRHRAPGSGRARGDARARGRAPRGRRGRLPAVSRARLSGCRLRPRRLAPGRVPAHPPAARARRQPRHPLSPGRSDAVPALLRRGLRTRHRRPALRAGRRRGLWARRSRWTPTSR